MYLIIAIPIYKNKFQKPALFFSSKCFSIGSLIFIPYLKKTSPALVVEVNSLEEKKSFIRRNKIEITKINEYFELPFLPKNLIRKLEIFSEKKDVAIQEIIQKIIPTKIIKEIKNLKREEINHEIIETFSKKIDLDFIKNKLNPKINKTTIKYVGVQSIGSLIPDIKNKKTSLHSEKHYLVDEIRKYFGETATKGKGSFSFYLGFFKRIPKNTIYQYWSEIKQNNKPIEDQQKLFWWKIGQYLKK